MYMTISAICTPEKILPDQVYTIKNLQGHFENIHPQQFSEGKIYLLHHWGDFLMIIRVLRLMH